MARARNIKPGFFLNEELVELSFEIRLFFIGLWTVADREGRLEDKPKRIKMHLFPADEIDVDQCLAELAKSGFITRYEVDGNRFIQILTFAKHQNPHRDEKASTIPAPCKHGARTVQETDKHDVNRADSLIPDSLPLNPDSLPLASNVIDATPEQKPRGVTATDLSIAMRAGGINCQPGDPRLIELANQGVHTETVAAACLQAKTSKPGEKVSLGYVVAILTRWAKEARDLNVQGARASPAYQTANEKQKSIADRLTGKHRNEQPPTLIDIN